MRLSSGVIRHSCFDRHGIVRSARPPGNLPERGRLFLPVLTGGIGRQGHGGSRGPLGCLPPAGSRTRTLAGLLLESSHGRTGESRHSARERLEETAERCSTWIAKEGRRTDSGSRPAAGRAARLNLGGHPGRVDQAGVSAGGEADPAGAVSAVLATAASANSPTKCSALFTIWRNASSSVSIRRRGNSTGVGQQRSRQVKPQLRRGWDPRWR